VWRARITAKAVRMITEKSGSFRTQPDPDLVDRMIDVALERAIEPATRAWLLGARGRGAIYRQELRLPDPVPIEERTREVQEAFEMANGLSEPGLQGFTATALSDLYYIQGAYDRALDILRRKLELLDREGTPSERAMVQFETGAALKDVAGRYAESLDLAKASYAVAKDRSLHEIMHATYLSIYNLFFLGRWNEIPPFLDEHVAAFQEESEVACFAVRGGPLIGALMLTHQGETRKGQELSAMVHPKLERTSRAEGVRALVALAGGDASAALGLAEDALSTAPGWRAPEARWARLEGLRAREQWDSLREFLPVARNAARGFAVLRPACDRAEGVMHAAEGDAEGAVRLLRQALDGFEALSVPFEAAQTREELARLVGPGEARQLLDEASATYRRLEARPHAQRVAASLRAMTG
jgi:tetratricopeptide (TPR) repeat protein